MRHYWLALVDGLAISEQKCRAVWDVLIGRYGEPQRAYHNSDHITAVFKAVAQIANGRSVPMAVSLAILFHDVVYDPQSSQNEADSAILMRQQLAGAVEEDTLAEAERLILLTKLHQAEPDDANGRLLLDADLSILGAAPDVYLRYARAIRQEFTYVPKQAYVLGRTAVLQHFLQMSQIFGTQYGRQQWEAQARHNIQNELDSYQSESQ